jgi:hypothetical protein
MKRKCIYILTVAVLILSIYGCSGESGPVKIVLKFRPGQAAASEIVRDLHIDRFVNDSLEESYPYKEYVDFREETLDTLPGGKGLLALTARTTRIKPDPQNPQLADTSAWSITFKAVQHPNGFNELYSIPDSTWLSMTDYYRRNLEQMSLVLPDEPVAAGFEWDHTFKVILKDGEVKDAANHYRIVGFEEKMGYNCVVIDRDAVMILPLQYVTPDSASTLIQLTQVEFTSRTCLALEEFVIVSEESEFKETTEGTWYRPDGITRLRNEIKGKAVSNLTDLEQPALRP